VYTRRHCSMGLDSGISVVTRAARHGVGAACEWSTRPSFPTVRSANKTHRLLWSRKGGRLKRNGGLTRGLRKVRMENATYQGFVVGQSARVRGRISYS